MRQLIVLGIVLLGIVFPCCGASFYPARLDDPHAVYLTQDQFPVRGDGKADDSAAIQAAIDKVQETTGEGILFVPSGRYRVTRTIYVWPGVRVIGYGDKRPVFVLADKTPGFQEGIGRHVLLRRIPAQPAGDRGAVRRDGLFGCRRRPPERFLRTRTSRMPTPAPSIRR